MKEMDGGWFLHETSCLETGPDCTNVPQIGRGTIVGPFSVIKAGAVIGSNCVLEGYNTVEDSRIGDDSKLLPHAVICAGANVGNELILGQGGRIEGAEVGNKCRIWHYAHIGRTACLGNEIMIGKDCSIGPGVIIADLCKVQNGNSLYEGMVLERGAFIGPHCHLTNDRNPVAVDNRPKEEWLERTTLKEGCALGAGTVVRCGVTIGRNAKTGAGSLVTKNIPDGELWISKALPAEKMERG